MGQVSKRVMQPGITYLLLAILLQEKSTMGHVPELITHTATASNYTQPTREVNLDPKDAPGKQDNLPILQPSEAVPVTGTYILRHPTTKRVCLKATMGVEFIITENKKTWYYNLNPATASISGHCDLTKADLLITLLGNGGSLQLFFTKDGDVSYVNSMTAHLSPFPVCKGCTRKNYPGVIANEKEFAAACGKSFKCNSQFLFVMASELKIKLYSLQVQAFTLPGDVFGKEVECWVDFNKRVIPIIIGAAAGGVILIAVITCLIVRNRRRQGYQQLG